MGSRGSPYYGLPDFVFDSVQFVRALADKPTTHGKSLKSLLGPVMQCLVQTMMLTEDEIETYEGDLSEFAVAEEEDEVSAS